MRLLSLSKVAEILDTHRFQVRRLILGGKLKAYQVESVDKIYYVVSEKQLEKYKSKRK